MSASGQKLFKVSPQRGRPVAQDGVAEGLAALARALENLQVVGEDDITARLDWANGIPRITIGRKAAAK